MKIRSKAILLVGPTGCGKTPLGDFMEKTGVNRYRTVHFDFGAHLRAAVASPADFGILSPEDIDIVKRSLTTGVLLMYDQFPIAEKLLLAFAESRKLTASDLIVLNGMPRQVGQAVSVDELVEITTILSLECTDEVVLKRIAANTGGDRIGRNDDDEGDILQKLEIFKEQTLFLLDYYKGKQIPIITIGVEADTGPEEISSCLSQKGWLT
jgi:adenylate kinase